MSNRNWISSLVLSLASLSFGLGLFYLFFYNSFFPIFTGTTNRLLDYLLYVIVSNFLLYGVGAVFVVHAFVIIIGVLHGPPGVEYFRKNVSDKYQAKFQSNWDVSIKFGALFGVFSILLNPRSYEIVVNNLTESTLGMTNRWNIFVAGVGGVVAITTYRVASFYGRENSNRALTVLLFSWFASSVISSLMMYALLTGGRTSMPAIAQTLLLIPGIISVTLIDMGIDAAKAIIEN